MTEAGVAGGTSTIHHLAPVQMTLRGLHVAESATSAGPTRLGAGSATVPATRVETAVGDHDPGRRDRGETALEHCERCALQLCLGLLQPCCGSPFYRNAWWAALFGLRVTRGSTLAALRPSPWAPGRAPGGCGSTLCSSATSSPPCGRTVRNPSPEFCTIYFSTPHAPILPTATSSTPACWRACPRLHPDARHPP